MDAKRGFIPEDERNFSPEAMEILKTASRQICYLLEEGYDLRQAAVFVGNHYLLSERQRLAIMRSVASKQQMMERSQKRAELCDIAGKEIRIDGFNIIITLEVMLCDSLLFQCMDGAVRDLAALRGTYRLIPETSEAVRLMFNVLQEARAGKVHILLDEPVSNSGRLKSLIADIAEKETTLSPDIQILRDVDRALYGKEYVISSDSIILDHCISWVNLTAECMRRNGKCGLQVWQPC